MFTIRQPLFAAIAVLGLALTVPGVAKAQSLDIPSGTYKLDPTHGSVIWKVTHLGLSHYTARFNKLDATITLDAAHPDQSTVVATIDPASVDTDYPYPQNRDFNAELRDDERFFKVHQFPQITFKSTGIELTGDHAGKITGDLTLLGVTRSVTLDAVLNGTLAEHPYAKQPAVGFSAVTTVKRSDFGMDWGLPFVGDDVQVLIEAEFIKADQ